MRTALTHAANDDITLRVIPGAAHGLRATGTLRGHVGMASRTLGLAGKSPGSVRECRLLDRSSLNTAATAYSTTAPDQRVRSPGHPRREQVHGRQAESLAEPNLSLSSGGTVRTLN